jgi:hypothetical protein
LEVVAEDSAAASWRRGEQLELLSYAARVLQRFPQDLSEYPMGAITASLFANCMAHLPPKEVSDFDVVLPEPFKLFLTNLARNHFVHQVAKDIRVVLDLANVHATAATGWGIFALLHLYLPKVKLEASPANDCAGINVAGYSSHKIRRLLRKRSLLSIVFLHLRAMSFSSKTPSCQSW